MVLPVSQWRAHDNQRPHPTGLFWLYAAFGVAALWYLARRLPEIPETRNRSLLEGSPAPCGVDDRVQRG